MFRKKTVLLGIVLAVVTLVGATGCSAADLQSLQGIIKDIDSVSGNVTVMLDDGTTRTFNFNDVTMETIRDAMGDLSLECGDNVTIRENNRHQVQRMRLNRYEVVGTIASIGADNATITITTNQQEEITLNITANTTIRIQGNAAAAIADLQVGDKVTAKYDIDTMDALRINVNTGWEWGKHEENRFQEREQENNGSKGFGQKGNKAQQREQQNNCQNDCECLGDPLNNAGFGFGPQV